MDAVSTFFNSSFSSLLTYFLDFLLSPTAGFSSFSHIISLVPYFSLHPLEVGHFFVPCFSLSSTRSGFFFFHFPVPLLVRLLAPCFSIPTPPPSPAPCSRSVSPFLYFKLSLFFPTFFPANTNFFLHPFLYPFPFVHIVPHSLLFLLLFSFPNYSLLLPYFSLHFLPLPLPLPLRLESQFFYFHPRITHPCSFSIDANLSVCATIPCFSSRPRLLVSCFSCLPSSTFHSLPAPTLRFIQFLSRSIPMLFFSYLSFRLLTSPFVYPLNTDSFFDYYPRLARPLPIRRSLFDLPWRPVAVQGPITRLLAIERGNVEGRRAR